MEDIVQAFEQMNAHLVNMSPLLWGYYEKLKIQGFTEEQALELVKNVQDNLLRNKE